MEYKVEVVPILLIISEPRMIKCWVANTDVFMQEYRPFQVGKASTRTTTQSQTIYPCL